jgi:hypothetical protein
MPRWLVIALVVLLALALVPVASADVSGDCRAEIQGQDISGFFTGALDDPLVVSKEAPLSVTMRAQRPISRYKVEVEWAGIPIVVQDRANLGPSWASEVTVDDYAVYGMGLYKIVATSEAQDGVICTAEALVSVEGDQELDPLETVAGIAGLALGLLGLLGVLAVAARVGRRRSAPFLGVLLGAIGAVGVLVLLQQFSVLYPTVAVTGGIIAVGAAIGLAFSLLGLPARGSDAE